MTSIDQDSDQLTSTLPAPAADRSPFTDNPACRSVVVDGDRYCCIPDSHRMPEFFINLVSAGNQWMFLSSRGAITCGRQDADHALFPYYPADKLADMRHQTGPCTVIRILRDRQPVRIWRPFFTSDQLAEPVRQSVYKNELGNRFMLEEVHEELGLKFRYRWSFGQRSGFVRNCSLYNLGNRPVRLQLLDGLLNLLPPGLDQTFQLRYSNLADAYKKNELQHVSGIGLYYLSSVPTDLAEPSEGLRATAVWQTGLPAPRILLHDGQIAEFCRTGQVVTESEIRGRRGAFLAVHSLVLSPGEDESQEPNRAGCHWTLVADTDCEPSQILELEHQLTLPAEQVAARVEADLAASELRLRQLVASADGLQSGGEPLRVQRHLTSVLFNIMRGGLPLESYGIRREGFLAHLLLHNREVLQRQRDFLTRLPDQMAHPALLERLAEQRDPDLFRLGAEYLPFGFSRRHGDPSRPWNSFHIGGAEDPARAVNYEGNWRDIFQNWEALTLAWPGFCQAMVFRFLNASTADGYNPYRISHRGMEWEIPDPRDPWSNIGYWGDHQLAYLTRLLEWSWKFNPERLRKSLDATHLVYAEIPYRIGDADRIRQNPRATIDYDPDWAGRIARRVESLGADGKLLTGPNGDLLRVGMVEKLLVPALAKLASFVPGGGLWLNTQRPEWNDANNALAGYGLSVVSVCYLHRYLGFLQELLGSTDPASAWRVSHEVRQWMDEIANVLADAAELGAGLADRERRVIVDRLAAAGAAYRVRLYDHGLSGEQLSLTREETLAFLALARQVTLATIRQNRRSDGLFHSYNLLDYEPTGDADRIRRLELMLEGQVAVLSASVLDEQETASLLDQLRGSRLYRTDQNSFLLYPNRQLPRFMEKNQVSRDAVAASPLLTRMLAAGRDSILRTDRLGGFHFHGSFRNAKDLQAVLDRLQDEPGDWGELVRAERQTLVDLFESTFRHREFTGRSGSFFGYEGLGCIYWHMVSKLIVAIQENLVRFSASPSPAVQRILWHYRMAGLGLGVHKRPAEYGGFPTDPYSHTPEHAGAQQPGMTGQVKEDILIRMTELGVRIVEGSLWLDPRLLEPCEFHTKAGCLEFVALPGELQSLPLPENSLAFTFCQVPFVYQLGNRTELVISIDGKPVRRDELFLTWDETQSLFAREGRITRVVAVVPRSALDTSGETS